MIVALERQLRLQIERGFSGRLTLGDLVDEWWRRESRLALTTRANYRQNLDRHVLPVLGDHRVEEIRPRLLGAFFDRLRQQGLSGGTVRKVRTVLSAVMSYAVAMEYAVSNPVMKVSPPPAGTAARVAPTLEKTARFPYRQTSMSCYHHADETTATSALPMTFSPPMPMSRCCGTCPSMASRTTARRRCATSTFTRGTGFCPSPRRLSQRRWQARATSAERRGCRATTCAVEILRIPERINADVGTF